MSSYIHCVLLENEDGLGHGGTHVIWPANVSAREILGIQRGALDFPQKYLQERGLQKLQNLRTEMGVVEANWNSTHYWKKMNPH